jgi:hypothetical protein
MPRHLHYYTPQTSFHNPNPDPDPLHTTSLALTHKRTRNRLIFMRFAWRGTPTSASFSSPTSQLRLLFCLRRGICVSMLIYSTRSFLLCLPLPPSSLLTGWLVGCRLSLLNRGLRRHHVLLDETRYAIGEPVTTTAHPLGTTLTTRSIGSSSVLLPIPIIGCGSGFFATTTTVRAIITVSRHLFLASTDPPTQQISVSST